MERSTMLLIGKPSINGPSPMAMVNNQRVYKVIASSNTFEGLSKGLFDSCGVSRRVLGTSGNHRPFSRITLGHSPGSSRFVFFFPHVQLVLFQTWFTFYKPTAVNSERWMDQLHYLFGFTTGMPGCPSTIM